MSYQFADQWSKSFSHSILPAKVLGLSPTSLQCVTCPSLNQSLWAGGGKALDRLDLMHLSTNRGRNGGSTHVHR